MLDHPSCPPECRPAPHQRSRWHDPERSRRNRQPKPPEALQKSCPGPEKSVIVILVTDLTALEDNTTFVRSRVFGKLGILLNAYTQKDILGVLYTPPASCFCTHIIPFTRMILVRDIFLSESIPLLPHGFLCSGCIFRSPLYQQDEPRTNCPGTVTYQACHDVRIYRQTFGEVTQDPFAARNRTLMVTRRAHPTLPHLSQSSQGRGISSLSLITESSSDSPSLRHPMSMAETDK